MASKLNISAAYLSAIENDKRNVPDGFFDAICGAYQLSDEEKEAVKQAVYGSMDNYRVDLSSISDNKRQVLLSLTKDELDEEVVNKLCEVIRENSNKTKKL